MNIENTSIQEIKKITEAQRAFFRSGETLSLKYRQRALCALSKALKQWEPRIAEALWEDLHKSYEEAYLTELSIVLGEIDNHLRHLKHWVMRREARWWPSRWAARSSWLRGTTRSSCCSIR